MLYTSKELILRGRRVLRYLRKRFKTKTAADIASEAAAASALALSQRQEQEQEQREKEQEEEGDDEDTDAVDNKPPVFVHTADESNRNVMIITVPFIFKPGLTRASVMSDVSCPNHKLFLVRDQFLSGFRAS